MRFGVDDALERIAVILVIERLSQGFHVASVVIADDDGRPYRMDKSCIPLRAKARAADSRVLHQPLVVFQVFGNGQMIGRQFANLLVDPLHQAPAVAEVVGRLVVIAVDIANVGRGVPAQAVNVIFVQPHERVVAQELPHFRTAVVRPCMTPGRLGAVVVIEIDAPAVLLPPAVESPQIQVARSQMVIDHIENDGDPVLVGCFDEFLESKMAAIIGLDRERQGGVVAPGARSGEGHRRHDLHRVDAQRPKVREFLGRALECPDVLVRFGVKRAHVDLVDHHLVPGRAPKIVRFAPIEIEAVDDAVAHCAGHLARVGIEPVELLVVVVDHILVFMAGNRIGNVGRPISVGFMSQWIGRFIPLIERSGDEDRVRVRRPDTKGRTLFMGDRPHPGLQRGLATDVPGLESLFDQSGSGLPNGLQHSTYSSASQ